MTYDTKQNSKTVTKQKAKKQTQQGLLSKKTTKTETDTKYKKTGQVLQDPIKQVT